MKNHPLTSVTLTLLLLPLLLLFQGCGLSTSEVTFGSGDHVSNSRGHGTGEVFEIKLEVIDAGGTNLNANQVTEEGLTIDGGSPVQGDTTSEIVVGNVRLTLVKSPSGDINLSVDGKNYGQVHTGDSIVVDEGRGVAVNGVPRTPQQN